MDRPDWITPPVWRTLRLGLLTQPEHADDALADLEALTAGWTPGARERLVARVARMAVRGTPLPAALMTAIGEVLDGE